MKQTFQLLWPYARRYRREFVLGFSALALKDLFGAGVPLAIRAAIDALTRGSALSVVFWFCASIVGVSALRSIFQYWMRVILIGISRDVEFDLRNDLFASLVKLDSGFYAKTRTGDILARATNDLNAVRMMMGPGVMYLFETGLTLVLAVAVMAFVDWRLTLVALIPGPVISVAVMVFGRRIHDRFQAIQAMFSDISSRVQESLAGVRVVRAYVQEHSEQAHFETLNQNYVQENLQLARLSAIFNPLLQALVGLSFLLVLWAGGVRLAEHKLSLGGFVMFNTYMGVLVWPMIAMGWVANLLERGKASADRVGALLAEQPSIAPPPHPKPLPVPLEGAVTFENVTVRYGERAALHRVNLVIPAGATVAIVGHTGSGKSTLAHLVPRLIDPSEGAVTVDGIDVREFSPHGLRSEIGFVPQETFLFSTTLAGNIAFGVKSATDQEIQRAAEIAGLAPDLAGFPEGLQTIVGERGITLSGGQKQRTAIARAVLRNPKILILDDALASVDTATEERILSELAGVMRGRTTILISHRVSTIRHADIIFVVEHGEVVDQGTHAELLERDGFYADLYQKQLLEEELETI